MKTIPLPEPRRIGPMSVEQAMAERRSVRNFAETPLTLEQVSQLLWSAQGVSYAPNRRTAPSAGATYPLMVWLVVNRVTGLESGVYRFHQQDHCLELHKPGSVGDALVRACLNQRFLRDASVVLALAAVYDRTTARYGERGVRYVHMECGHAGQNISLQAAALGLGTVAVGAFEDDAVQRVLDVPHPVVYLFPVGFPK